MPIHLGPPRTPHPHHTLPPPSLGASQLQILRDMCIDHQVQPNAGDNSPVCPMAGPDNPVLVQTLVSLYSPGCHCQPVLKVHTPLVLHPLESPSPTHLVVGPVSRARATSGIRNDPHHYFDWLFFGVGILFFWPVPREFKCSLCQVWKALWCGQSHTKCPVSPHTKQWHSCFW